MSVSEVAGDPVRPTEDLVQARSDLDRWGLAMVSGAISDDLLARVRARLYEEVADDESVSWGNGIPGFDYDVNNRRIWGLLNRGRCFSKLAEHSTALTLLEHLLGERVLLSSISANVTIPGHQGGGIHADQQITPEPWPSGAQGANAFWCIDEFTPENGGTLWAPGSHTLNRRLNAEQVACLETVPLQAPAGTLCVMDGRVYHGTGANTTASETRAGIFGYYTPDIYRTQENWFLSLNPLVLQGASETMKYLLGYNVHGGLGLVNGSTDLSLTDLVRKAGY